MRAKEQTSLWQNKVQMEKSKLNINFDKIQILLDRPCFQLFQQQRLQREQAC